MGTIAKIQSGGGTHLISSSAYGTCATAASIAEKVATIQDSQVYSLIIGSTVHIKMTESNTAMNPTLNVNGTGAKPIMRYGTTAPSNSVATSWNAGSVVSFTFDGNYWQMNDWVNTDTNTTYSVVSTAGAGLCPQLPNSSSKFLCSDGSWSEPGGGSIDFNRIYPVGSIYMSVVNTDPAILFGVGTWEQIKDTFLLSAGDTYAAGGTGGSATVTLDTNSMPNHSHSYERFNRKTNASDFSGQFFWVESTWPGTGTAGGSQAHDNMPPYLTVYMWKRTA